MTTVAKEKTRSGRSGWVAVLAATVAWMALPAMALAQQFEKVEGKLADEVPAGPFVGIAYGFIWLAILGYVLYVARGLARVSGEVAELRRKVDAGTGAPDRKA
jgi:CcmD family protein